jgi:glycosyltransferase involved in cell wall biosynthesis
MASALTVLVPTRNERGNIAPLLHRLGEVSRTTPLTAMFVDDSSDGTSAVIGRLAARTVCPVEVLHRPEHERADGLGGAVRLGLAEARSEYVCVMDADLQHPPELVPALLEEAQRSNADVVVASRRGCGGEVSGFSIGRRALSRGSEWMARALFPLCLRGVSDPMSGFFLLRRTAVDPSALHPRGFKILLEILLSDRRLSLSEVGFHFGERHAGESKATLREGASYLRRLIALRLHRWNPIGKRPPAVAVPVPLLPVDVDAGR